MFKRKKAFGIFMLFAILCFVTLGPLSVTAQSGTPGLIGMVADISGRVHVFDAKTNSVLGTVVLPRRGAMGDVVITADGKLGFVTNFMSELWVIDLAASPPVLASGTNPIPISNRGEDISISPDQKFLVVVDGGASENLSVVDIASRTEISTFDVGTPNSVEFLNDGSILVGEYGARVRRLSIDSNGIITDTGEILSVRSTINVYGSPDAQAGFAVIHTSPSSIQSFTIPGLAPVDTRSLALQAISGAVHPSGEIVYVRTLNHLYAYSFDSTTGNLGTLPLFDVSVGSTRNFFGMDQIAITPDGTKIYVSETNIINVYDAESGVLLTTLSDPQFSSLTGIYIANTETIDNSPSIASSGGPYLGDEGEEIVLDASGSSDPNGSIVSYDWDLDNDGQYDDATGITTTVKFGDNGLYVIGLKVVDGYGSSDTDTAQITVANVAPNLGEINAPSAPVEAGTPVNVSADFIDPGYHDTHTAIWDWGDGTTSTGTVVESNGSGTVADSHTYIDSGIYTVTLTVTDDDSALDQSVYQYVIVYDPEGGFVVGGGWIESPQGAYTANPSLSGKATFGFVSLYDKDAVTLKGETQFNLHGTKLNFHGSVYDWLVVNGNNAHYSGTGTINDDGDYGFIVTAIDGRTKGRRGADEFRIKIWDRTTGDVVYDNQPGESVDSDAATELGGGSIGIK